MEAIIAYLQSILGLRARQGWIFLLIGAAMLALVLSDVIPKEEVGAGWLAAFLLSAVSGAVILAVSAGYSVHDTIVQRRKVRQVMAERNRLEAEAVQTAGILRGRLAGELRSILAAGEQRFTAVDASELRSKNIVRSMSGGVHIVVDPVWDDRERLIEILEERRLK